MWDSQDLIWKCQSILVEDFDEIVLGVGYETMKVFNIKLITTKDTKSTKFQHSVNKLCSSRPS